MGSIKKGVVLLAIGHDSYFRMAQMLAASIKVNNPDIQIALINDGTKEIDSALFDFSIIATDVIPEHHYKNNLYDLTPFDATLYLDVDMILFPGSDLKNIFDELNGVTFTVMNKLSDHCVWASIEDIRSNTNNFDDPFHMYYSELLYFEKGKEAKSLFTLAKKKLKSKLPNTPFNKGMADELAFILAAMELRIKPHKPNWLPVFWHFRDKKDAHMQPYQLMKKYVAYSIGGNSLPQYVKATYNNLAVHYAKEKGISKPYKAEDKRYFLENRTKI